MLEYLSVLALMLVGVCFGATAATAEDIPSGLITREQCVQEIKPTGVSKLDRTIILEMIRLSRFNIHFHLESNYHWRGRNLFYPLAQEAGTGALFANTVVDLSQRARGLDNPELISKPSQKRGVESALVGTVIRGTSSASELMQNTIVAWRAGRQGFSPNRSIIFVRESLSKIDALLDRRQQIVSIEPDTNNRAVRYLEGRLLKHIRNQLLYEFTSWSIYSRGAEWRENTFYAIDAVRNFTSSASSIIGLKAFSEPNLRGASAITSLVANTLSTVNPWVRDLAAMAIEKYQSKRLARTFSLNKPRTMDQLLGEWEGLEQISGGHVPDDLDKQEIVKVAALVKETQQYDQSISKESTRIQKLRRVAAQQAISGPLIGASSMAKSICSIVAFYGYHHDPIISNRINFGGRIPQLAGQSFSLIATPTAAIKHYLYAKSLRKQGKLPDQILRARLVELDSLENQVNQLRIRQY